MNNESCPTLVFAQEHSAILYQHDLLKLTLNALCSLGSDGVDTRQRPNFDPLSIFQVYHPGPTAAVYRMHMSLLDALDTESFRPWLLISHALISRHGARPKPLLERWIQKTGQSFDLLASQ